MVSSGFVAGDVGRYWIDGKEKGHTLLDFYQLVESLKKNRKYDHKSIDLFPLPSSWIERSIAISLPFYTPGNDGDDSLTFELGTQFGNNFPIKPAIDREGFVSGSFITSLERSLLIYRSEFIANSSQIFNLDNGIWFSKLLSYFNTLISSFDITMMQFYYKAKYDEEARKLFKWTFDEETVGSTVTGRTLDKINWIYKITGNHIDNIGDELKTFKK